MATINASVVNDSYTSVVNCHYNSAHILSAVALCTWYHKFLPRNICHNSLIFLLFLVFLEYDQFHYNSKTIRLRSFLTSDTKRSVINFTYLRFFGIVVLKRMTRFRFVIFLISPTRRFLNFLQDHLLNSKQLEIR